ncbi:MAG TPA: 6-bladed beta-propeller [Sphingobacterium sp.]|nr:6-bladed beta-propeller [Sphingobacterium sp.]
MEVQKEILEVPAAPSEEGFFGNHFELDEVIRIETHENFLVSDIKRLIRYQDKVILLSGQNNTIFIINSKGGRIEQTIHRIGSGPGEYRTILDVAFDEESKQIAVYNDYGKVLFFNLTGDFISDLAVDGTFEGVSCYDGKLIFFNKLEGYAYKPKFVKIFHLDDKSWEEIGDVKNTIEFPVRSYGRPIVKSVRLWLAAPLNFILSSYEENRLEPIYELAIPNSNISDNLMELSVSDPRKFFGEVSKNKLIYGIHSIRETEDYIVFRSNQEGIFILDKNTDRVYWDKYVEEKALAMKLTQYYPHDGDDDKIMFVVSADYYTENLRNYADKGEIVEEVKNDDNPLLLFYKQKN